MDPPLGEHAPPYATVKHWMAQFKRGDFSTCDAPRPGRPTTVTTPESIDQIHELILEHRQISAKSTDEQLGISRKRVGSIIHEDMDMRKLSAKWVPKCLNADQKRQRWQSSEQLLIDYLPKGHTINAEYYSSLLVQLKDILKEKRRGKVSSGGGGSCSCTTMPRLTAHLQPRRNWSTWTSNDHQPYSPDLAPSDYHLFPGLKKQLKGDNFSSDAVNAAAETWLDGQSSDFFFLSSLQNLEQRAKKCIKLRWEYVE